MTAPDSISRRIGVPWPASTPHLVGGGVRVGVEMDDADGARRARLGDGGGGRPGDRVVAAEDDAGRRPIAATSSTLR